MPKMKNLPDQNIADQYVSKKTLDALAAELGVARETVRRRLIKHGISIRQRGRMADKPHRPPILDGDDFESFRAEIENFCIVHDMTGRMFGTLALRRPSFVWRLDRGAETYPRTVRRVREWMQNYTPPPPKPKHRPMSQRNDNRAVAAIRRMRAVG